MTRTQSENLTFLAAIEAWTGERRRESSLMPNDLCEMDSIDRLLAFKQDDIFAAVAHLKAFPKQSAAPFVRQIIKWCCDNPRGYCNLSVPRLAKLLNRSERHIHDCLADLEKAQLISSERRAGEPTLYWPVISRAFASNNFPLSWFIDHFSPPKQKRGRPRVDGNVVHAFEDQPKNPCTPVQGFSEKPLHEQGKTPANRNRESVAQQGETASYSTSYSTDGDGGLREGRADFASPASRPSRSSAGRSSSLREKGLKQEAEKAEILPAFINRQLLDKLAIGCASWHADQIPFDHRQARDLAASALVALTDIGEQFHEGGFRLAVARVAEMAGRGETPFGAAPYFRKALLSEARRLEVAADCARHETEASAFQAAAKTQNELATHARIQERRVEANDKACAEAERKAAKQAAKGPRPLTTAELCEVVATRLRDCDAKHEAILCGMRLALNHFAGRLQWGRMGREDWLFQICVELHRFADYRLKDLTREVANWAIREPEIPSPTAVLDRAFSIDREFDEAEERDEAEAAHEDDEEEFFGPLERSGAHNFAQSGIEMSGEFVE